jgi:Zn-dependent M28 family amino/carboxypeptidase
MRTALSALFLCLGTATVFAQMSAVKAIDEINTPDAALSPLRFLAADELMGRGNMRPEINIAARYLSEEFRRMGVKEVPGASDYFQLFELRRSRLTPTGVEPGNAAKPTMARNVLGWIEGTDPMLKNQFIVLSAHYDHLGVATRPVEEEGKTDSIYNGARDNAIGVAAVLAAARYFVQHPPKRSVLFIAYTGEEIGLRGSRYFAEHPLIPLNKLVYNLNIDNASYNDTTIVSVIGLGRTSADQHIQDACASYGLKALPDPEPAQNLFDRSDNVSLAVKGIPAPTYSLGMRKFDDEINKRYHRLSDEVGNLDTRYAMKYIKAFILAAQMIADDVAQPTWAPNDKYEAAWKALFKR